MQREYLEKNKSQILDFSSSMVLSFDLLGNILYVNPSFVKTLGYEIDEIKNLTLWDFLGSEGVEIWKKKLEKIKKGEKIDHGEITYFTKEKLPLSMTGIYHLLKDDQEKVFGLTVFLEIKAAIDHHITFNVNNLNKPNEVKKRTMMPGGIFSILEDQTSTTNRFLDAIDDFVFFKDIHGVYRGCNKAFAKLHNLQRDDIIGRVDEEIHSKETAELFRELDGKIKKDRVPRKTEEWITDGNGKKLYVETIKSLYLNNEGQAMGYLGIGRNFTDRKNAEKQWAQNQLWQDIYFKQSTSAKMFMLFSKPKKLYKGIELTHDFITTMSKDFTIRQVNEAMLTLYGVNEEYFIGKTPSELPFYNTRELQLELPKLFKEGQLNHLTEIVNAKGNNLWIEGTYTCLYNEEGQLFGVYVNQKNVTNEINLAQEGKEREKYLRAIIDTTRDGYYAVDINFNLIDVNEAFCKMSGYSREEILGMSLPDLLPEDKRATFYEEAREIMQSDSSLFESSYLRKDGSTFESEVSVSTVGIPVNFFISFIRDITERKQLESFYLIEKELFKNSLLSAAHGMISTGPDGKILIVNSVAEKLIGKTQDEAKGKPLNHIITVEDNNGYEVKDIVSDAMGSRKTVVLNDDYQMSNHFGEKFFVELTAAPILDDNDSYRGVVVTLKDTTKRREIMKNYEDLSYKDSLTGLYNRRYLDESLKKLEKDAELPITMMVVDVNSLKLTNDAFGHALGDKLLKSVAKICKQVTRQDDVVCRSGGDEFVIILPNTDRLQAKAVKDRIISKVNKTYVSNLSVSLAIGFSTMKTKSESLEKVHAMADHSMYQNKLKYGKEMKRRAIEKLLQKLNHKSEGLLTHNQNVSLYSYEFAKVLGLSEKKCDALREAGLLHDIGKIMLTPQALIKAEINTQDFKVTSTMKHVEVGYQLLKEVDEYAHLAEAVLYHHECYDGSGYPSGLKGKEIPLEAQILSITNFYEIMTGQRSYRDSLCEDEAIKELRLRKGSQFDPSLVEIFISSVAKNHITNETAN